MLHDSPPHESGAWHDASDEAWAGYAEAKYAAAVARRDREAPPKAP